MGDYFLAVVSAKDAQDYARQSDENDAILGEEGKKLFEAMFKYVDKYESKTGGMRSDLSYSASKK